MGDLLDWREEVLENAARAEVDLGVDLHAGDETKKKKGQLTLSPIKVSVLPGSAQSGPFNPERSNLLVDVSQETANEFFNRIGQ